MVKKNWLAAVTLILVGLSSATVAEESLAPAGAEPKPIAVEEVISDKKIQQRLSDILAAVGTYEQVKVKVLSGVVILSGLVDEDRQIEWVQNLATRMNGVAAVQSQLTSPSYRDPQEQELRNFTNDSISKTARMETSERRGTHTDK